MAVCKIKDNSSAFLNDKEEFIDFTSSGLLRFDFALCNLSKLIFI